MPFTANDPVKIDEEQINELIANIAIGVPIKYAFNKARIPESFYYVWLKLYDEYIKTCDDFFDADIFQPTIVKDKNNAEKHYFSPVCIISKIKEAHALWVIETHKKINNGDRTWTSAAWLLERRAKEDYNKDYEYTENGNRQIDTIKVMYVDSKNQDTQDRLSRLEQEVEETLNGN